MSDHHDVHFKYLAISLVSPTSIKLRRHKRDGTARSPRGTRVPAVTETALSGEKSGLFLFCFVLGLQVVK